LIDWLIYPFFGHFLWYKPNFAMQCRFFGLLHCILDYFRRFLTHFPSICFVQVWLFSSDFWAKIWKICDVLAVFFGRKFGKVGVQYNTIQYNTMKYDFLREICDDIWAKQWKICEIWPIFWAEIWKICEIWPFFWRKFGKVGKFGRFILDIIQYNTIQYNMQYDF